MVVDSIIQGLGSDMMCALTLLKNLAPHPTDIPWTFITIIISILNSSCTTSICLAISHLSSNLSLVLRTSQSRIQHWVNFLESWSNNCQLIPQSPLLQPLQRMMKEMEARETRLPMGSETLSFSMMKDSVNLLRSADKELSPTFRAGVAEEVATITLTLAEEVKKIQTTCILLTRCRTIPSVWEELGLAEITRTLCFWLRKGMWLDLQWLSHKSSQLGTLSIRNQSWK